MSRLALSFHSSADSVFFHRNTWKRRTVPCIVGDASVAVSAVSREPQAGDRAGTGSGSASRQEMAAGNTEGAGAQCSEG